MSTKIDKNDFQVILDRIVFEAELFREKTGSYPKILKLPFTIAYDLARGTREQVGFIANKTSLGGIKSLDGEHLYRMRIQIVRGCDAKLDFE